jgi:uncharacterized protein YdaU (DUF1376 family)
MKHYPHHIGDFDKATRHLSRLERSVYRDLIDLYYDTEQRLTLDMAALCRRVVARSNEEATAVQQVLNEFFIETPTGWYHDRCEAEIEAYHANTSQKALAGKASAEAKRLKRQRALNGESTAVEQPLNSVATEAQRNSTNHQPINQSTNQPSKKERERSQAIACPPVPPEGLDPVAWDRWVAYRSKIKKSIKPVSVEAAQAQMARYGSDQQAVVMQSIAMGWTGLFDLKDNLKTKPPPPPPAVRNDEAKRLLFGEQGEVIDA